MHSTIFLFAALALAAPTSPPTPNLPKCDTGYNYDKVNKTLRQSTLNTLGLVSSQAQQAGMASIHILGYKGYGDILPDILQPMTEGLNGGWTNDLSAARIKCPACTGSDGKAKNVHPRLKPVVPYRLAYSLFEITTNMLLAINEKQCSVDGFTPSQEVRNAMRPFLDSIWAAMGSGPASSKADLPSSLPSGAVVPYYDCLSRWGVADAVKKWEQPWFALNQILYTINQTDCVNQ